MSAWFWDPYNPFSPFYWDKDFINHCVHDKNSHYVSPDQNNKFSNIRGVYKDE